MSTFRKLYRICCLMLAIAGILAFSSAPVYTSLSAISLDEEPAQEVVETEFGKTQQYKLSVKNNGSDKSYVRISAAVSDLKTGASYDVHVKGENWKKCGEYYYFEPALASLAVFVMMLLCEVSVFAYSTTRSNAQDITYIARKNMTVTFTVENGTFEDGSTDPIIFSVPYGKTLSLNQIPTNMKPATGYTAHGSWSPATPDTSNAITKDITYTYSFRPPVVTYHANAKDVIFAGGKDTHIVGYIQNDKTNKNDVAKGYEYQDPTRKTYRLMSWNYTPDGTGKTFDINTAKITDDIDVYAVWKKKEATFIDGPAFHDKILSLSHNAKWNSFSAGSYRWVNTNIEAIKHASEIPEKYKTSTNLVSTQDSDYKIYAWFVEDKTNGEGTLYWWSEATADGEPAYMNADAGSMFSCLWKLKDISGLVDMDTSRTTSFSELFYSCPALSNISPVSNWNTS